MGENGPTQALKLLKEFYEEARQEDAHKAASQGTTLAELKTLINISPNQHDRVPIEKSAIYAGYKLIWAARIFI